MLIGPRRKPGPKGDSKGYAASLGLTPKQLRNLGGRPYLENITPGARAVLVNAAKRGRMKQIQGQFPEEFAC